MSVAIRLDGVVVRDADRQLLSIPALTLDAPRTAVIGPNGSGKSTLLRLLNGLSRADEGTISLDQPGQDSIDVVGNPGAARSVVGFVFSDPLAQLLLPTPLEDVTLSVQRVRRAGARERALAWLDEFAAAHLADHSVYELSSGERQRVALASVLAAEPKLLVLDEPTTLLDRVNVRRLEAFLDRLNIPHIMATHDLSVAARYERVLWIQDAQIAADGPGRDVVQAYIDHADAAIL